LAVGVVWVAGKRFLVKCVVDGMLRSAVADPSNVLWLFWFLLTFFTLFLCAEIPGLNGI
jgi:hypothetical protein